MATSVLYLGDTALRGAAGYLAGLMHRWGWAVDYVPSDQPTRAELLATERSLFVLSDYASSQMAPALQEQLTQRVHGGAGLLMIGGWESFHGCGGNWDGTPVAAALPVEISGADDRVNCDQPALIRCLAEHPATRGLPWDTRPPCVGGYNRLRAKPAAATVLEVQQFRAIQAGGAFAFQPAECDPLLVVGSHGRGRVAALATDVAPHWVGGLVDWGPGRVTAQAPGAETIEVGDLYDQFLHQLLSWTAGRN